ncbi:hypothetical protein JK364_00125 [Streptomyces sp. 110]|uniref:Amidase domain-containing protein n=1 Tax=Streptomyces endocoffeicus TaxID=2898945 RepID=A0ABS1PFB5_9ACTN|nr:amidase family protein [Streptomyces endocoffeicus]MBL1110829.1 hypothetical protein [Streptomyces endocoffeicus]
MLVAGSLALAVPLAVPSLQAASKVIVLVHDVTADFEPEPIVSSVGYLTLEPNSPIVVPRRVHLVADSRASSPAIVQNARMLLLERNAPVAQEHDLTGIRRTASGSSAATSRVNGDRGTGVNAFAEILVEDARAQAEDAAAAYPRAVRDETPTAPLLGVPVATKEKHALAGRRIEQGLAGHAGRIAAAGHPVVERIRRAGGIIHACTTSAGVQPRHGDTQPHVGAPAPRCRARRRGGHCPPSSRPRYRCLQ